uniref:Uncharacterized protein n=1 Tax=Cyprinus carpio TaxID=7962 RepID=A0A8C1UCU4_CYPCA
MLRLLALAGGGSTSCNDTTPGRRNWTESTPISVQQRMGHVSWQVQILSNETQRGFHLIAEEMQGLYTAVYQNRLVLDIMTSEKGGICKMLNEKCCFNVPANHKNMTSVIEHMRNAIRPPPQRSDNGWFVCEIIK